MSTTEDTAQLTPLQREVVRFIVTAQWNGLETTDTVKYESDRFWLPNDVPRDLLCVAVVADSPWSDGMLSAHMAILERRGFVESECRKYHPENVSFRRPVDGAEVVSVVSPNWMCSRWEPGFWQLSIDSTAGWLCTAYTEADTSCGYNCGYPPAVPAECSLIYCATGKLLESPDAVEIMEASPVVGGQDEPDDGTAGKRLTAEERKALEEIPPLDRESGEWATVFDIAARVFGEYEAVKSPIAVMNKRRSRGLKSPDGSCGIDTNRFMWRQDPDKKKVIWYYRPSCKLADSAPAQP